MKLKPLPNRIGTCISIDANFTDTILDPKLDNGGRILLPENIKLNGSIWKYINIEPKEFNGTRRRENIAVGSMMYINNLDICYDNIVIALYKNDLKLIKSALVAYKDYIVNLLIGKDGLLNSLVAGTRLPESFSGVIVQDPRVHFGWIAVPSYVKIEYGAPIVFWRHPILHPGSIMAAKGFSTEGYAIGLHPAYYKLLNADNDGDMVFGYIPNTESAIKDCNEKINVLNMCTQDHLIEEFANSRTGGTVGRMANDSLDNMRGVGLSKDILSDEYLIGISREQQIREGREVFKSYLSLKFGVGIMGMCWQRIVSLFTDCNPPFEFVEKLEQKVLDAKHQNELNAFQVGKALNLSAGLTKEEIISLFDGIVDEEEINRIVLAVIKNGGLSYAYRDGMPLYSSVSRRAKEEDLLDLSNEKYDKFHTVVGDILRKTFEKAKSSFTGGEE